MYDTCPVCCNLATLRKNGTLGDHFDGLDKPCMMSGRIGTWTERSTRPAVTGRSGGKCEYCGKRGTEMHHRINRSVGGPWCPANIVHLCSEDHTRVTINPAWAKERGLSLTSRQEPGDEPVTRKDGRQFQPTNEVIP